MAVAAAACLKAARALGYEKLKKEQLEVVCSFIAGNDVFVALPTGFGKSLCYAILPSVFDTLFSSQGSIVVVVTPLTAIMKDQVEHFSKKGLRIASISGMQDDADVLRGVQEGLYQLVLFTPEMLLQAKNWRGMLQNEVYTRSLKALVVDEAHTVKKWGETFRRVLLRIGEIRSLVPERVNLMALTATATKSLKLDVVRILGMRNPTIVSVSPSRSNIKYAVRCYPNFEEAFAGLLEKLKSERKGFPQTIVYCNKLSDCGELYLHFRDCLGRSFTEPTDAPDLPQFRLVDMYHSSTEPAVKDSIITSFASDETHLRVVIATVAFGMGIDCPHVRQVIHVGPPGDSEAYIQETGRAGRDGLDSIAILSMIKGSVRRQMDSSMKKYIDNNSLCRRNVLFDDFEGYVSVSFSIPCLCCDVCARGCQCMYCKS